MNKDHIFTLFIFSFFIISFSVVVCMSTHHTIEARSTASYYRTHGLICWFLLNNVKLYFYNSCNYFFFGSFCHNFGSTGVSTVHV